MNKGWQIVNLEIPKNETIGSFIMYPLRNLNKLMTQNYYLNQEMIIDKFLIIGGWKPY
jgi:hypothetical protein